MKSVDITHAPAQNKKLTWLIFFALVIFMGMGIVVYIIHADRYPITDDSYVQANVVNITPQITGTVNAIGVKDQQFVKQGQILLTVDPRPFQYAVENGDAALKLAKERSRRILPLIKTGQVAPAEGDVVQAQVEQSHAALEIAQYNLEQTTIKAPADGILAGFNVRVGDTVTEGVSLFALVEQSEFWVEANFKETQLRRIRIGQPVRITVDMYPNYTFTGTVQSMNPGSGSPFSLLPPENATGNWVKVTQRVPVRVLITHLDPRYPLLLGTSAVTRIDTTITP